MRGQVEWSQQRTGNYSIIIINQMETLELENVPGRARQESYQWKVLEMKQRGGRAGLGKEQRAEGRTEWEPRWRRPASAPGAMGSLGKTDDTFKVLSRTFYTQQNTLENGREIETVSDG